MKKCPDLQLLPEQLDLGQLLERYNATVNEYNKCKAKDGILVDYETPLPAA